MTDMEVMTVPTPQECDCFFESLPPARVKRNQPAAVDFLAASAAQDDDIAKINKDAPAIIAFADGVSAENREAVLLGVEFAEAVANQRGDIEKDPINWLREYAKAFRYAGWLTVGGHEYGSYTTSDRSLTMDKVVLDLISSVAGPNAATVVSLLGLVLDRLQKNEPLMRIFERNSRRGNYSQFRIMPCVESKEGIPVTYLLSIHTEYKSSSGGTLFWKWSITQLDVKRLAKGVEFSKATFERNKQRVLEHLDGEADDFFNGLKR
jgi:hypothetical protein